MMASVTAPPRCDLLLPMQSGVMGISRRFLLIPAWHALCLRWLATQQEELS